mgnify:CR=1 FL=1
MRKDSNVLFLLLISIESIRQKRKNKFLKTKKGFSFVDDGILVSQFERNFQYDETEDQLSAILDVYNDMEKEMPMERLVCGDVGFGR